MKTQRTFCARFVAVAFTRLTLGIIMALAAASAARAMNKTWTSLVSGNFTGPGAGSGAGANVAVPEPASLAIVVVALACLAFVHWRRREVSFPSRRG